MLLGKCVYCLVERVKAVLTKFNPMQHSDGIHPKCFECNEPIYVKGMKTWDNLAKSFKLLCLKCGERQVRTDSQYRDTPWGYEHRLK